MVIQRSSDRFFLPKDMIYEFEVEDYNEMPFMHWKLLSNVYITAFTRNDRKYEASLSPMTNSWKLKLVRIDDEKTMIELRFRNLSKDDALFKAETYIMEYAE